MSKKCFSVPEVSESEREQTAHTPRSCSVGSRFAAGLPQVCRRFAAGFPLPAATAELVASRQTRVLHRAGEGMQRG